VRAWADGRPDKVTPRSGADLTALWRAELAALGYRAPKAPVELRPAPVGALDRDCAVDQVLTRLAAGRSAWNAADLRGEAERVIAAAGVVAEAAVRGELAEDLTARALVRCVPLLAREQVLEYVRAWTSPAVLAVEAELTVRFAARATLDATVDVPGPVSRTPTWPLPAGIWRRRRVASLNPARCRPGVGGCTPVRPRRPRSWPAPESWSLLRGRPGRARRPLCRRPVCCSTGRGAGWWWSLRR
jgi:hypothetical protein